MKKEKDLHYWEVKEKGGITLVLLSSPMCYHFIHVQEKNLYKNLIMEKVYGVRKELQRPIDASAKF
jgi:hypothetical protein